MAFNIPRDVGWLTAENTPSPGASARRFVFHTLTPRPFLRNRMISSFDSKSSFANRLASRNKTFLSVRLEISLSFLSNWTPSRWISPLRCSFSTPNSYSVMIVLSKSPHPGEPPENQSSAPCVRGSRPYCYRLIN